MHESLFGHLMGQFSSKAEDLATEALCYILERYPAAADGFIRYVRNMGVNLQGPVTFQTQCIGSQGSVPDLVGTDLDGRKPVIVESKFWAGLTENQPVTYLGQLPPESSGVLLFVAPRMRFATLWPELVRRCKGAALPMGPDMVESGESRCRKIGDRHLLALTSWRAILAVILEKLEAEGNQAGAADVRQLQGLCDRMDTEAFLPVASEELSPSIARRTLQFCALVNELTDTLRNEGVGVWKSVGGTIDTASYGRYVLLENHGCFLQFNPDLWARRRATPLWLLIQGDNWKNPVPATTIAALARLDSEDPPRLIREGSDLLVPLTIPLNVERDTVVRSLADQFREVAGLLRAANSATIDSSHGGRNA